MVVALSGLPPTKNECNDYCHTITQKKKYVRLSTSQNYTAKNGKRRKATFRTATSEDLFFCRQWCTCHGTRQQLTCCSLVQAPSSAQRETLLSSKCCCGRCDLDQGRLFRHTTHFPSQRTRTRGLSGRALPPPTKSDVSPHSAAFSPSLTHTHMDRVGRSARENFSQRQIEKMKVQHLLQYYLQLRANNNLSVSQHNVQYQLY